MDLETAKLKPVDVTVLNSVRHLAKSVNAIASQLIADLCTGDVAATLLWAHGELEKLSGEAESIAGDVLEIEQGRSGVG